MNSVKLQDKKISIQVSVVFLYPNKILSKREIKETIPFTITSKRIKYLGLNLAKEVKGLYTENYKTFAKEIGEDTNKWLELL